MPPQTWWEIRKLETQAGAERQSYSDSEILEEVSCWVLDLGHTRGWKKKYLNYVDLFWQMKALFGVVMKYKQVER